MKGLNWEQDGRDWPHRESSRFVQAAGLRWHVQQQGSGPVLLLLHGTGAATHSWRDLLPLLAEQFTVIAPDLPGHGFSAALPEPPSLPAMARALHGLLRTLALRPVLAIGHSAGAALLVRLCLDGQLTPQGLISINGALLPLRGLPGWLFAPLARLLAAHALVPRLFARRATDPAAIQRLIASTGSTLDPVGVALYARLIRQPAHVAGALAMMANWDLRPLQRDLPRLAVPLVLVVGTQDHTVPPAEARKVQALLPAATVLELPGLGHLAHEEQPQTIARLATQLLQVTDV